MRRKLIIAFILISFFSIFCLLSGCNHHETEDKEISPEGEQFIRINLSYPFGSTVTINITDEGYLTTIARSEEEIQKTVLLGARSFASICRHLERLDFSSPPKTRAADVWEVELSTGDQIVYFSYGYVLSHWKTDRPFINFTKTIIDLSPLPITNPWGAPIKSFFLPV